MNDSQIIALSITVLAILGATLINNARIGDVKEVLRAEMDARFARLDLSLEIRFNAMDSRFNAIDRKLDEFLRVMADHDHRIPVIE
jgi:low affinity Fe/Cu permease